MDISLNKLHTSYRGVMAILECRIAEPEWKRKLQTIIQEFPIYEEEMQILLQDKFVLDNKSCAELTEYINDICCRDRAYVGSLETALFRMTANETFSHDSGRQKMIRAEYKKLMDMGNNVHADYGVRAARAFFGMWQMNTDLSNLFETMEFMKESDGSKLIVPARVLAKNAECHMQGFDIRKKEKLQTLEHFFDSALIMCTDEGDMSRLLSGIVSYNCEEMLLLSIARLKFPVRAFAAAENMALSRGLSDMLPILITGKSRHLSAG